jgi:N6-adenosine-specific RNA methylase IME4
VVIVELDLGRSGRLRTGGDHDLLGSDGGVVAAGFPCTVTVCGSSNRAVRAPEQVDVVAKQLATDHLDLAANNVLSAGQQVGDRNLDLTR